MLALIKKSFVLQNSSSKVNDLNNLPLELKIRENVTYFHHNDLDEIRRAYLQRGSCQPLSHDFSIKNKKFSEVLHRFNLGWFKENKNWLDQIIKKG